MKAATHTPGPWFVREGDEWTCDVVTEHGTLPDGSPSYWSVASFNLRRDEARANARLIAAAPELLEAIGFLLCDKDSSWDVALDKCRAAYARATGEAA